MVWACATELSRSFSQCQLTSKLATYTIQLTRLIHCLTYKRFLVSWCKLCTFKLVLMCAILVINLQSVSVVSNVQCLWSNTTAQRGHHIHIIIINRNDYMEWNTSVRPKWRQHSSNELQTVIIAVQLCITKKCQPRKVGGTKHRASPPLQKVGGTCPPVHPRIYAHVYSVKVTNV